MPGFFGSPTWEEVTELVRAKDATINATAEAYFALPKFGALPAPEWRVRDPLGESAWVSDWNAMLARYRAARALWEQRRATSWLGPESDPGAAWQAVLHALKQAWDPSGAYTQSVGETSGDLTELVRRLTANGARPDYSKVPQPKASDPQLQWFQAADVAARAIQRGAQTGMGLGMIALVILGVTALSKRGR